MGIQGNHIALKIGIKDEHTMKSKIKEDYVGITITRPDNKDKNEMNLVIIVLPKLAYYKP